LRLHEQEARALGWIHDDILRPLPFFVQFTLGFAINAE
jgi:hypothetical protein